MSAIGTSSDSFSVSTIVKIELGLATVCFASALTMLALTELQIYSLLIPGYVSTGGAGFLFIGAFVTPFLPYKKSPENSPSFGESAFEQSGSTIQRIIHIPPARMPKHSVVVHPNTIKELQNDQEGEPWVRVGNAVYTAKTSAAIPEGSIGMSIGQRDQLRSDLGLKDSSDSMNIVLTPFNGEEITELITCSLEIKFEKREGEFLRVEKAFFIAQLHQQLNDQIVKKGQSFTVEIEGVLFQITIQSSSFDSEYAKISSETLFLTTSTKLCLDSSDSIPSVGEVTLEFSALSLTGKEMTIPEELVRAEVAKAKRNYFRLSEPNPISWLESDHYWTIGDQVTITHKNKKMKLYLDRIVHNDKSIKCVRVQRHPHPLEIKIEDTLGMVNVLSDQLADKKKKEDKTNPPKLITIPEEEKGLTIVQRLERRGVGGMPEELNAIFQPFVDMRSDPAKRALYEKWGFKQRKGVVLEGPPGTGKTSVAKHIGHILGCSDDEIRYAKGSDLFGKLVGLTEQNIKKLFIPPKDSSFFIVILDEVEFLMTKRKESTQDHQGQMVSEFLQQIDGIDERDDFLIIGITNKVDKIDTAFLRPGRLDKPVSISIPDKEAREKILNIYLEFLRQGGLLAEDIDLNALVAQTEGLSGADIQDVINCAKQRPMQLELSTQQKAQVTMHDLTEAIKTKNS